MADHLSIVKTTRIVMRIQLDSAVIDAAHQALSNAGNPYAADRLARRLSRGLSFTLLAEEVPVDDDFVAPRARVVK